MKIQCNQCQTVFFIDDSLISGKGVKAQCPRCGHQTVVRSDNSSEAPSAPPMGHNLGYNSQAPGVASPQPPPGPPAGPGDSFFGDQAGYFGGGNNNYFGNPGAAPAPPPAYGGPTADPLSGYTSPAPSPAHSSSLLPDNLSVPNTSLAGLSSGLLGDSTSIGPPPSMPEPLVAHTDDGATKMQPHPSMPYIAAAQHEDLGRLDPNWIKIRRIATGEEIGPVSLKEVRSLYVHGKIALDDEYAGEDLEWCPIREIPALLDILQRTPQLSQRGGRIVPPKHVTHARKKPWAVIISLFLLLAGGGGGAYYFLVVLDGKGKTQKNNNNRPAISGDMLKEFTKKWEEKYPDVKADPKASKALTEKGMALVARDQKRSYSKAITLFQKAILADRKNHRALAGLAVSLAWKPVSRKSSSAARSHEITQYEVLLRQQSLGKKKHLLRAAYALYLKRRDPDKALSLAKKAAEKAPKEALPQLIAGEIWLTQQQDYKKAQVCLAKALKLNEDLARGRVLMSRIMLRQARYYKVSELLKPLAKRKHIQAMFQQAQLYINKGQHSLARRRLQQLLNRDRHHSQARLLLATLSYQILQQRKSAARNLSVFRKKDKLTQDLRLRVLLHRAYLDLLSGRLKRASQRAKSMYSIDKNYLPGKFLEAQVLFARRKYGEALKRLDEVAARLPNELKVQLLKALIMSKQSKKDDKKVTSMISQMAEQNSRYIWPRLLLASTYIKYGQTNSALAWLKRALDVEPDLWSNQQRPSAYYIAPLFWQEHAQRLLSDQKGPRSINIAGAGIVYYQLGNMRQAVKSLRRSLKLDAKGLAANLYIAQYFYDTNKQSLAQKHAARAYQVYDQHAISAQILGLIALKRRQYKKAEAYLKQVRRSRPWFITGQVAMALTYKGQGSLEDAMEELKSLLDSYHYHHFLARALQQLKR